MDASHKIQTWVDELTIRVPEFVHAMQVPEKPGKYKFSVSGDIPSNKTHWGLGQSTFAVRSLYIFDALDAVRKKELREYILSFLKPDGCFYDRYVIDHSSMNARSSIWKKWLGLRLTNDDITRAESRQALAGLCNLEFVPNEYQFSAINYIDEWIKNYVRTLNWHNPWAACSHVNHLIFFIKYNALLADEDKSVLYDIIEDELRFLPMVDGLPGKKTKAMDISQYVGGAMKLIMGMSLIDRQNDWMNKKFIDKCLSLSASDACTNFNVIYTLAKTNEKYKYRSEETIDFFLESISQWMKVYYKDEFGGFSFYPNRANHAYYGTKVTQGKPEPDLHGTAMFCWGLVIVAKTLKLTTKIKLKEPIL